MVVRVQWIWCGVVLPVEKQKFITRMGRSKLNNNEKSEKKTSLTEYRNLLWATQNRLTKIVGDREDKKSK